MLPRVSALLVRRQEAVGFIKISATAILSESVQRDEAEMNKAQLLSS